MSAQSAHQVSPASSASSTAPSGERPFLKRTVTVGRQPGRVTLQRFNEEIELEGPAAQLFSKVEAQLDGKASIEQIAARVQEKPARLRGLLGQLAKAGVLSLLSPADDTTLPTGMEFYAIHK